MNQYDAIVVGVGGVGSAVLYHLAQRGAKVLGLDRFAPGHDRGSSHGRSRMWRRAYFEAPEYVPLVDLALTRWRALEELSGKSLLHTTGIVYAGPEGGEILSGVQRSAAEHSVPLESWGKRERKKFADRFHLPDEMHCVFEPEAGYLDVEQCIVSYADAAIQLGAELRIGATVRNFSARGSGVTVETESGQFSAGHLVVTAGPWAKDLLLDLCIPFEVRRKPLYWYAAEDAERYSAAAGCPGFLYESPDGVFYGFPQIDELGVKVAEHSGGLRVPDPLAVDRGLDTQDQKRVEGFVEHYLPGVQRRCTNHTVCMYTMSPDGHFVVDRHFDLPNVSFAAGLSGHGYKFASVLGEALADLAQKGETELPIGFFTAQREGLAFTDLD